MNIILSIFPSPCVSTALLFTSYLFYFYFLLYIKYKIYTEEKKNDEIWVLSKQLGLWDPCEKYAHFVQTNQSRDMLGGGVEQGQLWNCAFPLGTFARSRVPTSVLPLSTLQHISYFLLTTCVKSKLFLNINFSLEV